MTDWEEAGKKGLMIANAGFITRLFLLLIPAYILIFIVIVILLDIGGYTYFLGKNNGAIAEAVIAAISAFILIYLIELRMRSIRKKQGFHPTKDITEDIEQREIDKRVAMEQKALNKLQKNDTKDLGYWFDLFEKGAITEDEYNKKKRELI